MGTNKKKYLTYLAWFGFVLAFLMLARYLYFHVEAELDADLASDLVFAEYVSEEKNPVPTGWCYSTDLRVLNTQLIFAPLFYLIQNWHMIRVVGTLLCLAIMIGSYAWLAYNLEVSYFPVMAVLFLCPLSKEYIYVVLCGAAYTPHITISFLTVGTFLYLWKHSIREKKNRIILLFLELLSFGAGLAGYRQLLVCYIPFMITVGLFWMFSPKNKEYLKLVMLAMSALICPGRFDRRIPVELPDLKGREDILKVHAAKIKIADNVDFNAIARTAAGASGAELANIVNEAALRAVRDGRKFATQTDLMESVEVVIAGYQKKNRILSTKEKLVVSYHEVGHALVAALQTNSAPVQKITIIPRTSGALGFTMQVDEGEKYLMTKEELENKIATFTGGRVAEELVFGDVTTGASNDIEQATKLARAIITRYGMSEFGMVAMESLNNVYLGGDTSMSCSQETAAKIDDLVVALVQKQYEKAKNLLNSHMDKLHEISKFLYEHETITGEEFMEILNRPQIVAQD